MEQPLGIPKTEFLERVRQSLGRSGGPPLKPYYRLEEDITELRERAEVVQAHLIENRPALLDRFAEVAGLRGWQVFRTSNPEEAIAHVQGLAVEREVGSIVRSDQDALKQFPLDEPLRAAEISVTTVARDDTHSREDLRGTIAAAGIGDYRGRLRHCGDRFRHCAAPQGPEPVGVLGASCPRCSGASGRPY